MTAAPHSISPGSVDEALAAFGRATTETQIPYEMRQEAIRNVHGFLVGLRSATSAGDPRSADEAMHRLWSDWLSFYTNHFRGVAGLSYADQVAFYEIAQPIMRGLATAAPLAGVAATPPCPRCSFPYEPGAAERYWEARWRDEKAENDRLRAQCGVQNVDARSLVDWTYLYATEGGGWPDPATITDHLIALSKRPPTQEDANLLKCGATLKALLALSSAHSRSEK